VHDHDDATVVRLLRAVRAALPPDGTALIAEPMSGQAGAGAMADAYFGFYLLAMDADGRAPPARLPGSRTPPDSGAWNPCRRHARC